MAARGHEVLVVTAHPHYPSPSWGTARRPYREVRDGVPLLRLPLAIGRATRNQRLRQEASYAAVLTLASAFLPPADRIVAVSPSFPALAPAVMNATLRRVPWFLWLQDILPDGAATTGHLDEGLIMQSSRQLERIAYRSAAGVAVISERHRENLLGKGVAATKLRRVYNPVTQGLNARKAPPHDAPPTLMSMGNIGSSQGLEQVVRAFCSSEKLASTGLRLLITGEGVAAESVRAAAIVGSRVELPGIVTADQLDDELNRATLGLVSQRSDVDEFNLPSKLMNFMGRAVPVLAVVQPGSEVANIVRRSEGGWVVPSGDGRAFEAAVLDALEDPAERRRRGLAGHDFARRHFSVEGMTRSFEELLGAGLRA